MMRFALLLVLPVLAACSGSGSYDFRSTTVPVANPSSSPQHTTMQSQPIHMNRTGTHTVRPLRPDATGHFPGDVRALGGQTQQQHHHSEKYTPSTGKYTPPAGKYGAGKYEAPAQTVQHHYQDEGDGRNDCYVVSRIDPTHVGERYACN